jgi:mono/diheme cytochrome c family protein
MCVTCHGAPGVDASEAGEGLNPAAPDLSTGKVQKRSDGELFWLVQGGIRMTGMPAFGPTHNDEEIWKIVAFVRRLPALSPEEQQELKREGAKE